MTTPYTEKRASLQVSTIMPTPVVVHGKPVVPAYMARLPSSTFALQGPHHIHAGDPAPVHGPEGWVNPPPDEPTSWFGRWVVDDLPDPPNGGYYWLGDPSYADGTGNYSGGRTRWAPHASTPNAPAWRSFFPYKPSVRAFDSYLPDGGVVHHPKGVHLNSQFVEHMWLDFGGKRPQPFTWVIAGMIAGFPHTHYTHYLLDAGRNPDKVHFPRLSVGELYQGHRINDDLDYRNLISYSIDGQEMCTRHNTNGPHTLRSRVHNNVRPKMFFGVFNGKKSMTGAFGPNSRRHDVGTVDNSHAQAHRFYVMGRAQNHIDQDLASHFLVFEIRYWRAALTMDHLNAQYDQLSSTYKFNRYGSV